MDPDFFTNASLVVIKLGCFISVSIIVGKKIAKDWRS